MRHRSRALHALGALIAAPFILGANVPGTDGPGTNVRVTVTGLRSSEGVVRACLTDDARRFPKCNGDSRSPRLVVRAEESVVLSFDGVPPGRYAIALLHDENGNGVADRAIGMIPVEGFGFSRDAKVRMGPPAFRDAAFDVGTEPVRQSIRMRYML